MPLQYSRAKPAEVRSALPFMEPDRPLFSPPTWDMLPRLLEDLLRRDRMLICFLRDSVTGNLRYVGGSAFLRPAFIEDAMQRPDTGVLETAFRAEAAQRSVFLNQREVAESNRRMDLRQISVFGVPLHLDLKTEMGMVLEAWNFFHKGFRMREILNETATAQQARMLEDVGMRPFHQGTSPMGAPKWLARLTREEALANPGTWPHSAMLSSPPRFGFTLGQQKLLEQALLDRSDRDAAEFLDVTAEVIKKRWRSIYEKVAVVEPGLLPAGRGGADRRRLLLHRLRQNLEELRPY